MKKLSKGVNLKYNEALMNKLIKRVEDRALIGKSTGLDKELIVESPELYDGAVYWAGKYNAIHVAR